MKPKFLLKNYKEIYSNPKFFNQLVCVVTAFAAYFTFLTAAPKVIMVQYHISRTHFGWIFGLIAVGFISGNWLARKMINTIPSAQIIFIGDILCFISALFILVMQLLIPELLIPFVILLTLLTFGIGMVYANSVANAISVFPNRAGLASAIVGFTQFTLAYVVGEILAHTSEDQVTMLAVIVLVLMTAGLYTASKINSAQYKI